MPLQEARRGQGIKCPSELRRGNVLLHCTVKVLFGFTSQLHPLQVAGIRTSINFSFFNYKMYIWIPTLESLGRISNIKTWKVPKITSGGGKKVRLSHQKKRKKKTILGDLFHVLKIHSSPTQWQAHTWGRQSGRDSKMTSRTPIGTVTCSSSKFLAIRVRRKTRPTLSCEEAAICRRPMARLFSLDVERLRRFSRGAASLPEEVWRTQDKGAALGGPQLLYWTHGTMWGTDTSLGVSSRQWHAPYTASLGGSWQESSPCKGTKPIPTVLAISVPEIHHLREQTCI